MNTSAEREGFRTHSEVGQGLAPHEGRNPLVRLSFAVRKTPSPFKPDDCDKFR